MTRCHDVLRRCVSMLQVRSPPGIERDRAHTVLLGTATLAVVVGSLGRDARHELSHLLTEGAAWNIGPTIRSFRSISVTKHQARGSLSAMTSIREHVSSEQSRPVRIDASNLVGSICPSSHDD
jgi:hypothetical protein